jgi:hypothetical protein
MPGGDIILRGEFERFYNENGKKAGIYTYGQSQYPEWIWSYTEE